MTVSSLIPALRTARMDDAVWLAAGRVDDRICDALTTFLLRMSRVFRCIRLSLTGLKVWKGSGTWILGAKPVSLVFLPDYFAIDYTPQILSGCCCRFTLVA